MNNFFGFSNYGGPTGDPEIAGEYYNYLQGKWKDSTSMLYGGNGHSSGGAYGPEGHFMFPGLSDPCNWGTGGNPPNGPVDWTEISAENEPNDRRGLCSMGPFTLEPGGFHKIDIALVSALGDNYLHSVDVLMEAIDSVKSYYFTDPDHFGYAWLGHKEIAELQSEIEVYPNPVNSTAFIKYYPESDKATYTIYDSFGRQVSSGKLYKTNRQVINLSGLKEGLYILQISDNDKLLIQKLLKQ